MHTFSLINQPVLCPWILQHSSHLIFLILIHQFDFFPYSFLDLYANILVGTIVYTRVNSSNGTLSDRFGNSKLDESSKLKERSDNHQLSNWKSMRAMVRSDKKSKATSTGTLGTESGIRKFTLSCSRCRASKLKCDRKEPCVCGHF